MSEQDYIPGTQVIRNLVRRNGAEFPYGTVDQRVLDEAENFYIPTRLAELSNGQDLLGPGVKPFSFAHMRKIHQHLFQDVYAWAGEPRRVPMTKNSTSYAEPAEMNALLREQYAALAEQNFLQQINSREEFTKQLAGFWAEINHGHAFREGNTRSQTVFFEQLAHHAGWSLDVARLSPHHPRSVYSEFVDARFEYQRIRDASGGAVAPGSLRLPGSAGVLSAPQTAQQLSGVLLGLIMPDRSPEGCLRRGEAEPKVVPAHRVQPATPQARFPELRNMKLDPYGLADNVEHSAGDDYQL
ncbi:Fic/DOC family protein [Arthrobacter alpinus]|uniref:Fic/DOC family protein n=1 Tax=Arthrobacter alpinus TaxID=656366 RepID=UPI000781A4D1|nr:Fic family protein [Arthrobacter alpinus]